MLPIFVDFTAGVTELSVSILLLAVGTSVSMLLFVKLTTWKELSVCSLPFAVEIIV